MPPIPPRSLVRRSALHYSLGTGHSLLQRIIMSIQDDPNSWALQKFGVGQPVPRTEDPILVQGRGTYSDDVNLEGQAYAAIVRSRHAHGVIKGIDTSPARAMPGVIAVYTGKDLEEAGYGP